MESVPWLVGSAEVLLCTGCIFVTKYRVGCWEMEKQHGEILFILISISFESLISDNYSCNDLLTYN